MPALVWWDSRRCSSRPSTSTASGGIHPTRGRLLLGARACRSRRHARRRVFGRQPRQRHPAARCACASGTSGRAPGQGDMATQGSRAKYTYAIAERVEASRDTAPCEPRVRRRGGCGHGSAVRRPTTSTTMPARRRRTFTVIADTAATRADARYFSQSQLLLVLGPKHAATIAATASAADVQRDVYEHARLPFIVEAGRDVGGRRLATLDGDGGRARAPAGRPRAGRRTGLPWSPGVGLLHRRPDWLLLGAASRRISRWPR